MFHYLKTELASLVHPLIPGEQTSAGQLESSISEPPKFEMGQAALPCFPFAKALRKAPQQIAQDLATQLSGKKTQFIAQTQALGLI